MNQARMNKILITAAILSIGWCSRQSPADPPTTAPAATQPADPQPASRELLAHIQKQLRTVDTMQADFVQKKHLSMLKHTLVITGRLAMKKPNKVIWIVNEPTKYAIRVDGEELIQWDDDTNKVEVIHLGGDPTFKNITEQIQAWFLGDYKVLEKSYDVYLLSEKPLSLRFAPQAGSMVAKLVKNIEITFGNDETQVDKMVINETTGDSTALVYSNTRLNQPIAENTWEIPPK
jgi:outer membrane lipoprotein carrier protein